MQLRPLTGRPCRCDPDFRSRPSTALEGFFILNTVRHVRGGLAEARRTGDYAEFLVAIAELRRLASSPAADPGAPADARAAAEARRLFAELRGVVRQSVRVDGPRQPTHAA